VKRTTRFRVKALAKEIHHEMDAVLRFLLLEPKENPSAPLEALLSAGTSQARKWFFSYCGWFRNPSPVGNYWYL
jgi:hypothetical protein